MPRVERSADVVWEGNVARGRGTIQGGSGALGDIEISLATRFGDADGHTSPDELLAASLAGCFALALSGVLTRAETPPDRLEAHAVVTLNEVGDGHRVTGIDLSVVGTVPGIDEETFEQAARTAEQGCPIANVLNAEIQLDARLAT